MQNVQNVKNVQNVQCRRSDRDFLNFLPIFRLLLFEYGPRPIEGQDGKMDTIASKFEFTFEVVFATSPSDAWQMVRKWKAESNKRRRWREKKVEEEG